MSDAPSTEVAATGVNLGDASLFAAGPPHELFARLRADDPVHWSPPAGDLPGYYSLTRFADIVSANKDWRTFSSAGAGITIRPGAILPPEFAPFAFIFQDPPEHSRHRAIVAKVFTAGAVAAREDDIRSVVNALIDEVARRGACDLVTDIGARFPLVVTSNMLGVPAADHAKLFGWTNALADTELPTDQKMERIGELFAFIGDLVAKRRAEPCADLLSRLIHVDIDGERLSDMDVALHFVQITAGGNETTRDAFAGGMEALMLHSDERATLLEQPALTPNAVEEILRWHTPIHCMARTATRAVDLAGVPIEADQRVVLWYCSGNRDERANPAPDTFDVRREHVNHVAFGGGGVHYCIGNQLSRLELRIVLEQILRRLPDTELAGPVVRHPSTVFHSVSSVPVTFTPTR